MKYFGCLYAIGLPVMATGAKNNSAVSRVRTEASVQATICS